MPAMPGKTLYDKIWDAHVVAEADGEAILYIDLHLIHEVTTPQAFAGLRAAHRPVRRPDRTLAVADHNVPTEGQGLGVAAVKDEEARLQLQTLERNVKDYGIEFFPMGDIRNGIVHVVGPEQGRTQPGMTIVCGDSNTSTHGAFGALAHDETTFDYLRGRPAAPKGGAWEMALGYWKTFFSDPDAHWDREITLDAATIAPLVTWGTSPEDVIAVTDVVPAPESFAAPDK